MYVRLSTLHHIKSVSGDWVLVGPERAAQLMGQTDLGQTLDRSMALSGKVSVFFRDL